MHNLIPHLSMPRRSIWVVFTAALTVLGTGPLTRAAPRSIVNSRHNLSVTGPGTVKAAVETEICIFCHTPHGATAEAPLWNRLDFGETYDAYNSTTAKALFGQPTGASKLCLSCHDGTVALGLVRSRSLPIAFSGGISTLPASRANLGKDLSNDHPISFLYDSHLVTDNGELLSPDTLTGPVKLDRDHLLQCTSCHNPHDDQFGDFLVANNTGSALCQVCHAKRNWPTGSHATSAARWNKTLPNPWPQSVLPTVAENACASCHTTHTAESRERLLNLDGEENTCYVCHNGNVAAKNIQSVISQPGEHRTHPVEIKAGVHDPVENAVNPNRHVECADCHNPHSSSSAVASAPNVSGALVGVRGIRALDGSVISPAAYEYEICFRCHADSIARGPATLPRQLGNNNVRLQFAPGNASFHPVETAGRNPTVPSLIRPRWTESSLVYCSDCHNNDRGPGNGLTGPKGPHGSAYAPILERNLMMADGQEESLTTYALCYKCHDRNRILSETQTFKYHKKHVVDEKAACTTCHDSHGVASNKHLINFNTTYVKNSLTNGPPVYVSSPVLPFTGSCTLMCHDENHNAESYSP